MTGKISETTYEFWIPRKCLQHDEFCKKLNIKPKWIVKNVLKSECVTIYFQKMERTGTLLITNLIDMSLAIPKN